MRHKYIKHILIFFVTIATASDILFSALYRPILEGNPLAVNFGLAPLIILKLAIWGFVVYILWKNEYRQESHLFHTVNWVLLISILWGVMAGYTFITAGPAYDQIEEQRIEEYKELVIETTGEEATKEEVATYRGNFRKEVKREIKKIAIPYYIKLVYMFGVYPYVFSLLSFFIYERLIQTAKFKKRRQLNAKKDAV